MDGINVSVIDSQHLIISSALGLSGGKSHAYHFLIHIISETQDHGQ